MCTIKEEEKDQRIALGIVEKVKKKKLRSCYKLKIKITSDDKIVQVKYETTQLFNVSQIPIGSHVAISHRDDLLEPIKVSVLETGLILQGKFIFQASSAYPSFPPIQLNQHEE